MGKEKPKMILTFTLTKKGIKRTQLPKEGSKLNLNESLSLGEALISTVKDIFATLRNKDCECPECSNPRMGVS